MKKIFLLNIFALLLTSFQMSAQCTIQVVITGETEETCVGSSDASATATAAGSGSITYLWSDGQTTATATNLTTGNYTVTATDGAGCTGIASVDILLNPEGVWLMFTSTAVTCNGGSDGTAHVSVMTGVAPYTYIWNDPAGTTNADPVNLAAGQYTVTVTDSNGCSNYGPVTISEPTAIVIISSTTNETCFGDADGTASVSVSGGTLGYTYLWSDGQTTSIANNLTAGNYTVTVTDANGCPSTATLTVDLTNPQIVIAGTSTSVTCFGGNDGSATVTVNSGNGPFSYSWSNGGTSATISNLIAGDYTATVTGAGGCTSVTTISVSEPPELIVNTTTIINVSCNGGSDGSITVSSNGGTGSISYAWSNGGTSATISNLTAGTYTVTATDGNDCTATTSETITEPSELTATGSGTNVTVNGGNDGTASVTATGGTSPYTYLWSDGQTTANATNLTAGTYTVTVTDSNGCTTTTIVEIPEPPALTITSTPDTCGLNAGTATVTATGGTPGYIYLWSNGGTTQTITNLNAGDYTVTVTDAIGLTSSISTTVTEEGSTIIATTSHSNETCVGSMDGHVAVSTNGGVGQMTFLWSNGATTSVVNNLSVGTYTVTVTDEIGCTATSTEIIELSPEGIWVDITTTHVSCFNGDDGSANSVVTTGVSPYTYLWSNGATTPNISNLTAGDYTISVTDLNGCIGVFTTTVTQPTELIATTTSTNTTCELDNGTATVTATGGTQGYTYLWSNGATTDVIDNLSVGTYTATVTDANGCIALSSTTIINTNLDIITIASTTDPSGPTASDGAIDIEVSGGSGYTYMWSNGDTTQDISGLTAGCYTVTVNNSVGFCQDIDTICIGCILNLNVTTTNNDCINNNIGSATATVTSNCSNNTYTYNWTTGTGAFVGTTQTISGLLDGIYIVTVTDGNGYTVTGSGTVAGSGGITSTATGTNLFCSGDSTGTATVTGSDGSSTYTYLWSNGETTDTITNLIVGTYTVTVTDQNNTNCTSVSQVTITEPPVITITTSITNPTTSGGNDGSIDITVSGGTPGYTYLWSTGDTTQNITGLTEGCYTVTVTDSNGCTATAEPCIPPTLCLLTVTSTPENCNPSNNGTAMAAIVGCIPPVSFVWENSAGVTVGNTAMIINLTAGMYYVTVTDANLVTKNDSVEVTFVGGPDANANSEKVSCNSFTDGKVSATPTGGTTPYSYNWADANGSIGNNDTILNLSAGTYTVTVTDAVGCTDVEVVEITEDDPITLTQIMTPLDCFGDTDASITVTASGGVPNYSYQWSTSPTDIDSNITNLSPGVYTVTITDQNMCTKVDSFMISEPPAVTVSANPDTLSTCENFLTVNATASAGATISWFNQNNLPIGTGSPFAYLNIPSGTNTIYAVAEANGCKAVDSITVNQNAVDVSVSATTAVCQGAISQLTATNNIDPDHIIIYSWTPASIFTAGANTATPTLNTSVTGVYEVYLSSENQFNCIQLDTITVLVQDTTSNDIIKQQCSGLEVTYTSTSGTEMIWNFGDGSPQVTAISTTHTYMSADDYTVMMILPPGTNNAACLPDTITKVIPVVNDPIFNTDFTLDYDPCTEDSTTVFFTDISTNVFGPIDSVWWTWQGDTISTNSQDSMVITQNLMDSLTIYVMSEEGCIDSLSKEIDIKVISNPLQDTIIACIGTDTTLNPTGSSNYQYTWSPVPNGDPNEINPMITATVSTTYSVTITDNSGANPCSIEKEIFVLVPETINDLQTSPDTILCEGGIVTLSVSSAIADNYNWYNEYLNDPIEVGSSTLELILDNMNAPQYYYVAAFDEYNCPTVDSIFAGNAEIIQNLSDIDTCIGSQISILGGAISTGEMLDYEWLDPNGMTIGMGSTLTFAPAVSGLYTVIVNNEYDCELISEFNINAIDISPNIQATADPDTIILGEIVKLNVENPDNLEGYNYLWTPHSSLIGDEPFDDKTQEAKPDVSTDYQVVVTDLDNGCTASTHVFVTVLDICERPYVFFPNVFSPNGDDINDVLKVESVVVDEVYFVIYNRWGEKVFEGNNVDSEWDGTHNGEKVSNDVYGFYLRVRCVNGKVYEEKGNVTVLR